MEDSLPSQFSSSVEFVDSRLISQGAEARVSTMTFGGRPAIVKERFVKTYRHPVLDQKLSNKRLVQEARSMVRCAKAGIDTPGVYLVDTQGRKLYQEYVDGKTVKQVVWDGLSEGEAAELSTKIGKALALMHDNNIIHGDLTTSNMMVRNPKLSLVMLDFGLSYFSTLVEDKAVDLYVLERAFLSTHPNSEQLFESILKAYQASSKRSKPVLDKLEEVRMRGRKKLAFG